MIAHRLALVALVLLALAAHRPAAAEVVPGTYRAVPERAVVRFTVAGPVGRVRAQIPFRQGSMTIAEDGRIVDGSAVLDATALSGSDAALEQRLRGREGLDVARHPTIEFAVGAGAVEGDRIVIDGDLTIRGVTRPVRFTGEVVRSGPRRLSALLDAQVDRTAFGITVGRPLYSRTAEMRLRLVMIRPRGRG